jgi:DNA polymerase III delta prime subunit
MRYSLEKKAELSVDERFKSKHEAIKMYFDSQLTKILLSQGISPADKVLEMGREIVSLKLIVQKLEALLVAQQSETQGCEMSLAHYKENISALER